MPTFAHRLRRIAGLTAALVAVGAAQAGVAQASPYEQISRDNGALGGSPLFGIANDPAALGDVGRYAGFERTRNAGDYGAALSQGFVRDIQTNATIDYGGGVQRIYGIDRAEKRALIGRVRGGQYQVVAVPIAGGAPLIISSGTYPDRVPEAGLSGDGRKAVVSFPAGSTYTYDLTGGVVGGRALLANEFLRFDSRSLSDTASVIIGYDDNIALTTQVFSKGSHLSLATPAAAVDAKGTTLAYVASYSDLVIRNLAAKTERRWPISARIQGPNVLRVADGGTSVVVAPDGDQVGARTFTPGTGTAFTLAPFGGRFATSIEGANDSAIISPGGRFALVRTSNQVTIVDTTNTHIVGANDGFSAAAYVFAGSFVSICAEPATFSAYLIVPSRFGAPAASRMTVLVTGGGKTIASGTITNSLPQDGTFPDVTQPGWRVQGTYDPNAVHQVRLEVTVTDAAGRNLTEAWTEVQPYC